MLSATAAVDVTFAMSEGVTVAVRTEAGFIALNAAVDAAEIVDVASAAVGVPLNTTPGSVSTAHGRQASWLTPRSWLIEVPTEDEAALCATVRDAFPDRSVHASPFGDALILIDLEGPNAEALLRQGGFLSLAAGGPVIGTVKRTLLAGQSVLLWRKGKDAWTVGVERSLAHAFVAWIEAALEQGENP